MRKMKAVVREFIDKALESANGSFNTDVEIYRDDIENSINRYFDASIEEQLQTLPPDEAEFAGEMLKKSNREFSSDIEEILDDISKEVTRVFFERLDEVKRKMLDNLQSVPDTDEAEEGNAHEKD